MALIIAARRLQDLAVPSSRLAVALVGIIVRLGRYLVLLALPPISGTRVCWTASGPPL